MMKFIVMFQARDLNNKLVESDFCFRSSKDRDSLIEEFKNEFSDMETVKLSKMIIVELNHTYKAPL